MPGKLALGRPEEVIRADGLKGALAEFLSTFLFTFAGAGSVIAFEKLEGGTGDLTPAGLIAVSLSHTFAILVAITISANISGGHVNPAVTLAFAFAGQVTVIRSILYVIAQLLGAVIACYFLKIVTHGSAIPGHSLGQGESAFEGVLLEFIITFGLIYTIYATVLDPNKGSLKIIAPLCIAAIVGANIFAAAPFSSASMNPARSFGPAIVNGVWKDHWVYWVGPLVGSAVACIVYEGIFVSGSNTYSSIPSNDQ